MENEVANILNENDTVGLFRQIVEWLEELSRLNSVIGRTSDIEKRDQMKGVYDSFFTAVINVSKQTVVLGDNFKQALDYSETCKKLCGYVASLTNDKESMGSPTPSDNKDTSNDEINPSISGPIVVAAESIVPEGVVPESVAPEGVVPEGVVPEGVVPEGVVPEGVVPEGVVPEGVVPEGVVPEGVAPEGVVSEENMVPVMDSTSENKIQDIVISGVNDAIPLVSNNIGNNIDDDNTITPSVEEATTPELANEVSRISGGNDRGIIVTSAQFDRLKDGGNSLAGDMTPEEIMEHAKELYKNGNQEEAEEALAKARVLTKAA